MENKADLPVHSASNTKEMAKKSIEPSAAKSKDLNDESTFSFDAIVKCMSQNIVQEYLHDILSFLLSDRSDLRLDASGNEELFLVNLIKNLDNLNCKYFNKRCASMSKQIIKVLDKNKDVYKCINFCENHGSKNTTVYKKEYIPQSQTSCCEEDLCCGTSNPQSITENLQSSCPNHQSHKVSQAFKSRWLNTTLKFIKDDTKNTHKYPEMSPMEATFVYSIITRCKEQIDMPPNSYYTPLKEAMQIFGLKYFFELTYIDNNPNETMSLMLEKIPKDIKSLIEGDKRYSNRFRNMKFIKQVKTRTSDENRAGRVVSRLKNQERCKTDANRLGDLAPAEIESPLTEDPNVHPNANHINNGDTPGIFAAKLSRKNKAGRGGNFSGAETDGAGNSRTTRRKLERSSETRTNKLLKDMSVPIKSDKAMRMMYGMGWDGGALGARGEGITEPIIPSLDIKAGAGFGHSVRSRSPKKEPKNSMEVKASDSLPLENEALCLPPVKSNAPCPPPLERKASSSRHKASPPGHVTGHIRRVCHRADVFQVLLDMIASSDKVREVKQQDGMTKKERRFVLHAVRAANERNKMVFSDQTEMEMWTSVLEKMTSNPDLHIKATISGESNIITFTKDDIPYMSKKKKRKLNKKASILKIPALPGDSKKLITNDFLRLLTDTYVSVYAGKNVSAKAETGITFRVAILIYLLEIINKDRVETEIEFEKDLNERERDYVQNTVATLGARRKRGGSKLEQDLLTEITDNLEGYLLRVEFLNERIFKVHKVEKKSMNKSSRDISYTTCSTGDNDKNNLNSGCSDDSDAGHDDLYNDDNDGDDEHNDSNDVSEASKGPDSHQNEVQDPASPASYRSAEEKMTHVSVSCDHKNNGNEYNAFHQDYNPEETEFHVLAIDVQHSLKETFMCDNIKLDSFHCEKESDILTSNEHDFTNHTATVSEIDTQDFRKNTKNNCETEMQSIEKNMEINSETDIKALDRNTGIDSETNRHNLEKDTEYFSKTRLQCLKKKGAIDSETDMHDLETNIEINVSTDDRKKTVCDIIFKSHAQHLNKDPETSEKNEKSNLLETDIDHLGKEANVITVVSTENNVEKDSETEETIKLSNIKEEEIITTDIPQCSINIGEGEQQNTKINKYIKRVYLVPDAYPIEEVDTGFAKNVQIMISQQIEISTELPLLKCHGVRDGALIYSCHSETSLKWLKNVCTVNNVKIMIPVSDELRYKMALKINSFIDYTSAKLFKMLQLYNEGLQTESWGELSMEKSSDSLTFIVDIDEKSTKYIKLANFTLFAGIDQVQFKPVWN